MKASALNQLKTYLMMLSARCGQGEYFIDAEIGFKAGTKIFPAKIEKTENGLAITHGGGVSAFDWADLATLAAEYDSLTLVYHERGTDVVITADERGAAMKYADSAAAPKAETAAVGTREYLIAPPKASALLKEIGIMSAQGKIKNDMIRKYNQIDHFVELVSEHLKRLGGEVELLDCACGKSYLSFALNYYLKDVLKKNCHVTGVDYSETVIEDSRRAAKNLGYSNMTFVRADLTDFKPVRRPDAVISLHACDTATDMAIAAGINNGARAIFAVPCCHRELLGSYDYPPFGGILKHGIFKARQADLLTDGLRCLLLEAMGYTVTVQEYISPVETPKNLLIRAFKDKAPDRGAREEYFRLKGALGAGIKLEELIDKTKFR